LDAIVVGCDASRDVSYLLFYFGGKTVGYIFIRYSPKFGEVYGDILIKT